MSGGVSSAATAVWSCADAVASEAPSAILSYAFDESADAANTGVARDSVGTLNGTYSGERNKSAARGICYRDTAGFPYVLKGTGGYVQTPTITVNGAFSLETWFSTSTSTTTTARTTKTGFLLGSGTSSTTTPAPNSVGLYMTDDGRIVFAVAAGATSIATPAGTSYADGSWYDVVATYSTAGGASLFVNGRLIGTARPAAALPSLTGGWRIGSGSPGGWPLAPSNGSFSGSLRFATIYSTALAPAAVAQHAAAGSVPRTSDNAVPDYRG